MTDDDKPITLKQASEEFPFTVSLTSPPAIASG
jgi:hypothetical protein